MSLPDLLWSHTWWSYAGAEDRLHALGYRGFNLLEAATWFTFALLVLLRRRRSGTRSSAELWYALAFFTFGLTDVREAWTLTSWLIWLKLANLIVLLVLRRRVIRRYYPASKLF